MRTIRASVRRCAGASLLEVLIAASLLAVSLLGVAAAQLAALRDADAHTTRTQASWLAASIAEAMRSPELSSYVLARSRAYARARLPGAQISIVDEAADVSTVAVQWVPTGGALGPRPSIGGGACPMAGGPAPTICIAMPFAD